jgi:molybdopterin-binding protein
MALSATRFFRKHPRSERAIIEKSPQTGPSPATCRAMDFPDSLHERNAMAIQTINVRNQFHGLIKDIIEGSVLSEVEVDTPAGVVTSTITTRSLKELDLQIGSEVIALVKSTQVSLAKL